MIQRNVIPKLAPIYTAMHRYIVLYGGRGGGKSFEVARCIVIRILSTTEVVRVLCCREIQKSIKDSVHYLFVAAIYDLGAEDYFYITAHAISLKAVNRVNKSEIFFAGIRNLANTYQLKSYADIDICWIEEAAEVSQDSWDILRPTIRKQGSQIIMTFNPTKADAPTYKYFVTDEILEDERLLINVNYWDNPYISETLLKEMELMKKNDYERYLHHWEGQPLTMSYAAIFRNKFEVKPVKFYTQEGIDYIDGVVPIDYHYGMDFGFSIDPYTCVESFLYKDTLYITRELYHHGLETVDIVPSLNLIMPEMVTRRKKVYADSARPETISQLSKVQIHPSGDKIEALNIEGAIKGSGSIIEGIEWLKNYKIVIDPRCKNTIYEFNNYSYVTDKKTGDIMAKPEDKNNHCLTGNMIVNTGFGDNFIKNLVGKKGHVWSFNEETQAVEQNIYYDVRMTSEAEVIYRVTTVDGRQIHATANHLILTKNGWIEVLDLKPNDEILSINFNPKENDYPYYYILVREVVMMPGTQPTYNMEVDTVHNFSICGGLIVHNCIDALRYAYNDEIQASHRNQVAVYKSERKSKRRSSYYD